jgi:hypothetical protein
MESRSCGPSLPSLNGSRLPAWPAPARTLLVDPVGYLPPRPFSSLFLFRRRCRGDPYLFNNSARASCRGVVISG